MTLRKFFFWLHLSAGTVVGIVIFIMSVTGALLMYEKQIIAWADQRGFSIAAGGSRLPVETLIGNVRDARQAMPSMVTLRSDPAAPAMFSYGRDAVYANPYTGQILGEGSKGVREFFHVVTDWHRWLGMEGAGRATGKAITGACNLAFLFLVMSGFYLWWPRTWTKSSLKAVTLFRGGLSGKARDFNWHNVIGFWSAVPLFFVVLGATVISYPWASNLVYKVTGTEPPSQAKGVEGGKKGARAEGKQGEGKRAGLAGPGPGGFPAPPMDLPLEGINAMWSRAEQQVTRWKSISLRLPASERAPMTFTIDEGNAGQPQKRATLTVNRRSGEERLETFASLDAGRRLRSWLRFVHTGEYYGLTGQTIAGLVSAGGGVLVWTGIALSWRRFRAWQARKKTVREEALVAR